MRAADTTYWEDLTTGVGQSWNRFWFTPADPLPLCVLRIGVGLMTLAFFLSFTGDLSRWFSFQGLLPPQSVRTWLEATGIKNHHYSILYYLAQPAELWGFQILAILVALCMTAGLFTRVTTILTLAALLSYLHRAPMIAGHQEPILAMLLFYLCLAPAGRYLSLDEFWQRRKNKGQPAAAESHLSLAAAVPLRLLQVHLAAFYLMMAATKLSGDAWWNGDAIWLMLAQTHTRPLDLSGLREQTFLINAWTHAIIAYEFLYAVLIWNRLARPLLLAAGVLVWLSIALATGLTLFALTMLVANLAFVSPALLRQLCSRCQCVQADAAVAA